MTTTIKAPNYLLTTGNPKTEKGEKLGYHTAVLHLAPESVAGVGNVCPHATAGCKALCLNTAGRGGIIRKGETTNAIQEARKLRTLYYYAERAAFLAMLEREIRAHERRAYKHGLKPAVRLNGTSDIDWFSVAPHILQEAASRGVTFYEYTKDWLRAEAYSLGVKPRSMVRCNNPTHHTVSATEHTTPQAIADASARGTNVAVVFDVKRGHALPDYYAGVPIIDGDESDLRFLDPKQTFTGDGVVVGLRAKGKARNDRSGFVKPNVCSTTVASAD